MRTSRFARWLVSGALVVAGAATVFGGQTVGSGFGAQTLSSESADQETTVTTPDGSDETAPVSVFWEWT